MRIGSVVNTPYGQGTIIKREGEVGILSHRYIVRLDTMDGVPAILRDGLSALQDRQGGIAFFDDEFKRSKP